MTLLPRATLLTHAHTNTGTHPHRHTDTVSVLTGLPAGVPGQCGEKVAVHAGPQAQRQSRLVGHHQHSLPILSEGRAGPGVVHVQLYRRLAQRLSVHCVHDSDLQRER